MSAGPYGSTPESKEQLFVRNVETLISSENSKWKKFESETTTNASHTKSSTGS
nr:MAG TPA: SMODS and SLOG-associating 2TM effector domain 3 [Caudoviricetes sp.]